MGNRAKNDFFTQLKNKAPLAVDKASHGGHDVMESVESFSLQETFNDIKEKTEETWNSSLKVVRNNPVKSLAIALSLGLAAGYLFKRR
jgi:ElaB/YqjD/DUF883 family membrane-anchored ribosome-binding protein